MIKNESFLCLLGHIKYKLMLNINEKKNIKNKK